MSKRIRSPHLIAVAPLPRDVHGVLEAIDDLPARDVRLPLAVRLRIARALRTAAAEVRRARRSWYGGP